MDASARAFLLADTSMLPVQADGVAWWYEGDSLIPMPEEIRRSIYDEIVEHISRNKFVLARSLYSAAGKPGIHTRRVGLDRETNKELLLKHIHDKENEGAPFRELQQVLPGHNRGQIQVLLRELRKDGRTHCVGNTSAARWFEGPEDKAKNE